MSFMIVSEGGDGLGLALRLQMEGHKTTMWIRDSTSEARGEGLVEKGITPDGNPVIIADCTGAGALLDSYREGDRHVFSGSQLADKLECDRKFSSEVFKQCGIKEPQSQAFNSWEEAKAFVQAQDNDTRLVFKPEGKHSGNLPSYVSYDNADMLAMLEHFEQMVGKENPEFVLQEFIKGVCISSEAWFAKNEFVLPFNHTLERKQLMNGDLGPSGGCTGNVVWACDDENCPLCENLLKLEEFLNEVQWNGPIDINTVVDHEGNVYALEFTPRFGYDAFPTFLYGLFEGNFGEFINDSCRGESRNMQLRPGFAAGVRLSIPPWPSEEYNSKSDLPINGLRESDLTRFWPYEVNLQGDTFKTSHGWGIIGVSVGWGPSVEEAFEEAYRLCERIRLPDKQYRTDLVEVFKKDLTQLRRAFDKDFARV